MKLSIDPELCQGHGRCWDIAPELVDCDDSGHGFVLAPDDDLDPSLEARAREIEAACPERAVRLSI